MRKVVIPKIVATMIGDDGNLCGEEFSLSRGKCNLKTCQVRVGTICG